MKKHIVLNGLAGAAAVAGATQSYGAVVTPALPANIVGYAPNTTGTQVSRNVDLDGDGQRDISIRYRDLSEAGGPLLLSYFYGGVAAAPGSSVGSYIAGSSGNYAYAFSLKAGYTIGPSAGFYQTPGFLTHIVTNYNSTNYGFTNYLGQAGVPETIGFKFQTAAGVTDYGYLRLETDPYVSAANPGGIKFLALAYDNTGAAITVPTFAAVPEPGSLAALAAGAAVCAGVGLKRRRAAAKAE